MNYPSRNEVMELIHLFAASPANSKNERAFGLRDVRDCAVRLLDGEDAPEVNRNIIQDLPELGVCWVVQYDGAFGQEIAKLMEDNTYPLVDWSDTTMKTETKEHEINHVFEKALHQTAERAEPTTAKIQERHDAANPKHDGCSIPTMAHYDRGILLKRLEASHTKRLQAHGRVAFHKSEQILLAEELFESNKTNETLTRALGKANKAADNLEQGIKKYLDGDEPKYTPKFDCEHGTPHYKDCGQCIDEYFSGLFEGAR